jgi:hypothetical protein
MTGISPSDQATPTCWGQLASLPSATWKIIKEIFSAVIRSVKNLFGYNDQKPPSSHQATILANSQQGSAVAHPIVPPNGISIQPTQTPVHAEGSVKVSAASPEGGSSSNGISLQPEPKSVQPGHSDPLSAFFAPSYWAFKNIDEAKQPFIDRLNSYVDKFKAGGGEFHFIPEIDATHAYEGPKINLSLDTKVVVACNSGINRSQATMGALSTKGFKIDEIDVIAADDGIMNPCSEMFMQHELNDDVKNDPSFRDVFGCQRKDRLFELKDLIKDEALKKLQIEGKVTPYKDKFDHIINDYLLALSNSNNVHIFAFDRGAISLLIRLSECEGLDFSRFKLTMLDWDDTIARLKNGMNIKEATESFKDNFLKIIEIPQAGGKEPMNSCGAGSANSQAFVNKEGQI